MTDTLIDKRLAGFPETAEALNHWLQQHFQVFQGPARAYFELPFKVQVGDEDETSATSYTHRGTYLSMAFLGPEDTCCKIAAAHLYVLVTQESFLDAIEPVFIRRSFSYDSNKDFCEGQGVLTARLCFWRESLNRALRAQTCFTPEEAVARKAAFPKEWYSRP